MENFLPTQAWVEFLVISANLEFKILKLKLLSKTYSSIAFFTPGA